jgi:hypothetical protein
VELVHLSQFFQLTNELDYSLIRRWNKHTSPPSPSLYPLLITLITFELASMVCRNMCEKISSKIVVGESHYSLGKKYCRRCDCYFLTPKAFCECCGLQLRATPVKGEYKAKIRAKKRLVTV